MLKRSPDQEGLPGLNKDVLKLPSGETCKAGRRQGRMVEGPPVLAGGLGCLVGK